MSKKQKLWTNMAEVRALPSLKRRLLSGSAWAIGARTVAAFTALAINALLARLLSPQDLGAYFLAVSVVFIGATAGALGLNQAVVRFLAENLALSQFGRARRVVAIVSYLGGLGALGVALAYLLFGDVLSNSLFHAPALVAVTGLTAGWIALVSLQNLLADIFRGFHDIRLATAFSNPGPIAGVLLTTILVLFWLLKGQAALATVILLAVSSVFLTVLLAAWTLLRKVVSLPSEGSESRIGFVEVLHVALPLLVANLTIFGLTQADIWVLAAFQGEEEVAIYGAASRLATTIMLAPQILWAMLPPLIAERYALNDKETLERLVRGGSTVGSILVLPLFLAFVLFPNEVLRFVYGPYYESGLWILIILSLGFLINVATGIRGHVLMMTGGERIQLMISVIGGATNIVACTFGAIYWGIYGVAIAASTTMVLLYLAEFIAVRLRLGIWTHISFSSFVEEIRFVQSFWKTKNDK